MNIFRKSVLPARTRAVVGPGFAADRAFAHRAYNQIVQAIKGIEKWDADDDAFMDLFDARIVMLHRQAARPVPKEVLEKPSEIQAQADELMAEIEDEIARPGDHEPALDVRPVLPVARAARPASHP